MQHCQICWENTSVISCINDCHFCHSCLYEWLKVHVNDQNLTLDDEIPIKCPSSTCQNSKSLAVYYDNLSQVHKNALNDAFLLKFFAARKEYLRCPRPNCQYAGFISNRNCQSPFICQCCGLEWRNPQIQVSSDSLWAETKTFLLKEFTAKRCPQCRIYISKDAGCNLMRCTVCNSSFNWTVQLSRGWGVLFILLTVLMAIVMHHFHEPLLAAVNWFTSGVSAVIGFLYIGEVVMYLSSINSIFWIFQIVVANMWAYLQISFHYFVFSKASSWRDAFWQSLHLIPFLGLYGLHREFPTLYGYWMRIWIVCGVIFGALSATTIYAFYQAFSGTKQKREKRKTSKEKPTTVRDRLLPSDVPEHEE